MRASVIVLGLLGLVPNAALARDIDIESGLVIAPGFRETKIHCTVCHSAKRITNHRTDLAGWQLIVSRRGRHQKLPSLASNRDIIIEYLAAQYSPDSLLHQPERPARAVLPE